MRCQSNDGRSTFRDKRSAGDGNSNAGLAYLAGAVLVGLIIAGMVAMISVLRL
jgi:hypothetical protein